MTRRILFGVIPEFLVINAFTKKILYSTGSPYTLHCQKYELIIRNTRLNSIEVVQWQYKFQGLIPIKKTAKLIRHWMYLIPHPPS